MQNSCPLRLNVVSAHRKVLVFLLNANIFTHLLLPVCALERVMKIIVCGVTTHLIPIAAIGLLKYLIKSFNQDKSMTRNLCVSFVKYFILFPHPCNPTTTTFSCVAALPLCLSPSSASSRTTTSTDESSASCCP